MERRQMLPGAGFLERDEFFELFEAYRQGSVKALNRILRSHESLVRGIAFRYCGLGWPIEDLMQAGRMGLTYGLRKFDPSRNVKLTTYAPYWIRNYILTMIQDHPGQYMYRVPGDKWKRYRKINRFRRGHFLAS